MHCTDAIAFEAAAALDAYEEQLLTVRRTGPDPHRFVRLQVALRRVCNCCLHWPQLSAPSIALLLAHHGLLAELARMGEGRAADASPASMEAVEQCVAMLQRRCRELLLAPHLQ
jgi:hypothetical protein